jgi:hypothetical protein
MGPSGGRKGIEYLPEAAARGHDATVERATTKFAEAYGRFPRLTRVRCGEEWLP